jgi:hypothetical protein
MFDYLSAAEAVISGLYSIVSTCSDKSFVVRTVELIGRIANVGDVVNVVFAKCPDELLELLVELVCVNNTSIDPFSILAQTETTDNTQSTHKSLRVSKLPASISPFFTDLIDGDCRDAALEVIANLCAQSTRLQIRFASIPRLVPLLLRIIGTTGPAALSGSTGAAADKSGPSGPYPFSSNVQRTDNATSRAAAILASLSIPAANASAFLAVEPKICADATIDDVVAGIRSIYIGYSRNFCFLMCSAVLDIVCGSCMRYWTMGPSSVHVGIALKPSETLGHEAPLAELVT